jgi:hypothetical protein
LSVDPCDDRSGHRLLTLAGGQSPVGTAGFTPRFVFIRDGRRIATNDWQGRISVREAVVDRTGDSIFFARVSLTTYLAKQRPRG